MVIYADILFIVNFITDYFLLRLTGLILRRGCRLRRLLAASFLGAFFSFYIFLPPMPVYFHIPIEILLCAALTAAAFGFANRAAFVRATAACFGVTFAFGGVMTAVCGILKPKGMAVNNSVAYFNISPLVLITSAAAFYAAVWALRHFFGKKSPSAAECTVTLLRGGKSVALKGLLDTGNSVRDPFDGSPVITVNASVAEHVLCGEKIPENKYRTIPCKTVNGVALLEGFRIDRADVLCGEKEYVIKSPVVAVSKVTIAENAVIIDPASLE